jgi:hypothetical protein
MSQAEAVLEPERQNLAIPVGILLVILGAVASATVLEWALFPAGTLVGTTRRALVLGLGRLVLAAAGIYLVTKRPRLTAIDLTAFAVTGFISVVAGSVLLQVAYVPPRVVSGWKSAVAPAERNELGFRGRQFSYSADDYVVLLLGDSQVESTALDFDSMPERLLQTHLGMPNARVFSLGTGGYGQDQELLALEEYFSKYRANLVVLWQTPGNDVWNNVFKTHMANRNPKPTFWLDEAGKLQGPSEGLLAPMGTSRVVVFGLLQRAFGLPWRDKSWERSLPPAYVPMDHYDGPVRSDWQDRWATNLGRMRDENLATEKSHMAVKLTPRSARMQYGLDLTHALIGRIQQVVLTNHGRLVVLLADAPPETRDDEVYVLNGKYYRMSERQFDENWRYVNDGFDAETIPVTEQDWRVSPEDGHLNKRATDQVMSELANRLRSRIVGSRIALSTAE